MSEASPEHETESSESAPLSVRKVVQFVANEVDLLTDKSEVTDETDNAPKKKDNTRGNETKSVSKSPQNVPESLFPTPN